MPLQHSSMGPRTRNALSERGLKSYCDTCLEQKMSNVDWLYIIRSIPGTWCKVYYFVYWYIVALAAEDDFLKFFFFGCRFSKTWGPRFLAGILIAFRLLKNTERSLYSQPELYSEVLINSSTSTLLVGSSYTSTRQTQRLDTAVHHLLIFGPKPSPQAHTWCWYYFVWQTVCPTLISI